MNFFNSLTTRIPLAIIGGILYGLLTYSIIILLDLPSQLAISTGVVVFLFYLGSRLLILFSGIDSPYYSRSVRGVRKPPNEKSSFYLTAQWVGRFYHYHDIALFIFLTVTAIVFLITLGMDWSKSKPFGYTIQNLLNTLFTFP